MIGILIALLSLDVIVRGDKSLALTFYNKYVSKQSNNQSMDSRYK